MQVDCVLSFIQKYKKANCKIEQFAFFHFYEGAIIKINVKFTIPSPHQQRTTKDVPRHSAM